MGTDRAVAIALTSLVAAVSLVAATLYALLWAYISALLISLLIANGVPVAAFVTLVVAVVLADSISRWWHHRDLLDQLKPHGKLVFSTVLSAAFYLHAREMPLSIVEVTEMVIAAGALFLAVLIGTTGTLHTVLVALKSNAAAP